MKLSIALWAAVLAAASPATARELVYRSELTSSSTDAQSVVLLPRFDPSFGVLRSVRVDLQLEVNGRIGLENVAPQPGPVSVDLLEQLALWLPGDADPLVVGVQAGASAFLPPFDGALDFGGASGMVLPASLLQQRHFDIHEALDRFLTTATNPSLNLDLALDGEFDFGSQTAGRPAVLFSAAVQLTYVFEPHDAGRPRRVAAAIDAPRSRLELVDPRSRVQLV